MDELGRADEAAAAGAGEEQRLRVAGAASSDASVAAQDAGRLRRDLPERRRAARRPATRRRPCPDPGRCRPRGSARRGRSSHVVALDRPGRRCRVAGDRRQALPVGGVGVRCRGTGPAVASAARRAERATGAGGRDARHEPSGDGDRWCRNGQDPARRGVGASSAGTRRAGSAHLLQRSARMGPPDSGRAARRDDGRVLPSDRVRPSRDAGTRDPGRRRRRVVGRRRQPAPGRPLGRGDRSLRHDRGRRGAGLPPGVDHDARTAPRSRGSGHGC